MSRVQLLYDLVRDLRTVADDMQAIADALTQNDDIPALPEQPALPQTAADDPEPDNEPTAPITKEQVRDILKQLSRSGYRDAVQNIILSYGVATFSELPESEYADILKKAEEISGSPKDSKNLLGKGGAAE